jgi:excisionase family DNA binding protein
MVVENRLGPLMTVRDVARLLNVHNNTVRRWSDRGMIKAYRINQRGDRRFKRDEIARFLSDLNAR